MANRSIASSGSPGGAAQAAEVITWNGIPLVTSSSRARNVTTSHRDRATCLHQGSGSPGLTVRGREVVP